MLSAKKLLLLVGLVYLVKTAESCSCLPGHPQQAYCNGALAFGFQVLWKSRVNVTIKLEPFGGGIDDLIQPPSSYQHEMVRYVVRRFRLYQGNEKFNSSSSYRSIYTSGSSASCGVNLKVGRKYIVIGGYYSDNRLEIALCNHIIEKAQLTFVQQFVLAWNILYGYEQGCKCTIKNCYFDKCEDPRTSNECYTTDLNGLSIPYSQTTCQPYKKNCLWFDGSNTIAPKPQVSTTPVVLLPKSTSEE